MCDYCKHGKDNKDIINEHDMVVGINEDFKGFNHLFINGVEYKQRINFCPMCGRKLTTFEVNL